MQTAGQRNLPNPGGGHRSANIDRAYSFAPLSNYSFKDRILIRAADLVFFILIKILGHTVKFEVDGWENWEAASREGRFPVYTFWHNRVFLSTYFWQKRRIVVMTSRSFDGEYIARFIQRFGYGAARGSSTRGATGAVIEMVRLMRAGCPTAFTIDGPKGASLRCQDGRGSAGKEDGPSHSALHNYRGKILGRKEKLGRVSGTEAIHTSAS